MKLFFDSSYFFPIIKIKVEKSSPEILALTINQDSAFEMQYSTITLFELSAKGAKLIRSGQLTRNDVINGINALIHWENVKSVEPWDGEVQRLAIDFRKDHPDYIDCLVIASAIIHANVFISEDEMLKNLFESKWKSIAADINDEFLILNADSLIDRFNSN